MPKQNLTVALDNLLKTYQVDRNWLAVVLGKTRKELDTFLGGKKTTLGDLQELLSKIGIDLQITVRGEAVPPEGCPRMQFLKNNFMKHKNEPIVAKAVGVTEAPQCWWDADDIPLKDLNAVEANFGMTFLWNFSGMSETPDTMTSAPLRSERHKTIGGDMLKRYFAAGNNKGTTEPQKHKKQDPQPVQYNFDDDPYAETEQNEKHESENKSNKPYPQDEYIDEVKGIFEVEVPWLMEILEKNKTEEDLYFNMRDNMNLKKLDNVYSSRTMSALRSFLREKGYDISVRIWSDTRLTEPYRNLFVGFLWKWMIDNSYTMEQVRDWVKDKFDQYKDPVEWKRDDDLPLNALQVISDMTALRLSVILIPTDEETNYRDPNMMAFVNPNRRVKSLPQVIAQAAAKKTISTGKTVLYPSKARTPKALPLKDWLEAQDEYTTLRDLTPESQRDLLDGRLGENTVIALFQFDLSRDINLVKLHKQLLSEITAKKVTSQRLVEPDLDTTMTIQTNRTNITKLDCIEEIESKLSSIPKAQEMIFEKPVMTNDGRFVSGIIWSPSEGLALECGKKGFLFRRKEKIQAVAGHPEVLADLFEVTTWYMMTKRAREHYRLNGIQRVKDNLSASRSHIGDIQQKLDALHSNAVQEMITIVAEAQSMNLMDGFVEMIGDKMFAEPMLKEGKVFFTVTEDGRSDKEQEFDSVSADSFKTETILSLNNLLIEHIDKMLKL